MLAKFTAVFCVCVIGLAIADEREPGAKLTTKRAFAESFRDVALQASKRWGDRAEARRLWPYTEGLARKDAETDTAFLRQIMAGDEEATRAKLAALVLARRGGKEARDCLYTLLVNSPKVGDEVAYYMSPNDLQDVAERILVNRKEEELQMAALKFLGFAGDENSLALLKRMVVEVENETVRTRLQMDITGLSRRLERTPKDKRLEWAMHDLRYYRAARVTAGYRSEEAAIGMAARSLVEEGAFPAAYLRSKIKDRHMIAVAIAGMQREAGLVDDLANMPDICKGGWQGDTVMYSLASIGTAAAMEALAKWPKLDDPRVGGRMATVLAVHGRESAIPLLKKLSENEECKGSWPAFKAAIERIEGRLEEQRQAAKSRGSTAPASQPANDSR